MNKEERFKKFLINQKLDWIKQSNRCKIISYALRYNKGPQKSSEKYKQS